MLEEVQQIVEPVVAELSAAGVEASAVILEGPPAEPLLAAAENRQCDPIIMGTRTHGQLTGMLLGSVSYKVLANATMPCWSCDRPSLPHLDSHTA